MPNNDDVKVEARKSSDMVRALHSHFDRDRDGFLNYSELKSLQEETTSDGATMDENQYVMICKALDCHPGRGISLDALKLTYASDGTNVEEDYLMVFPDLDRRGGKLQANDKKSTGVDDYGVIEVGENGVDISPAK